MLIQQPPVPQVLPNKSILCAVAFGTASSVPAWEGGSDTSSGSCGRQSQNVCIHFLLQTENWRNTLLGQNKYIWHLSCVCTSTFVALKLNTGPNLIYTKVSFHHFGSRKGLSLGTYYIFFSACVNEDQAFTLLKIDVNDPLCCQNGVERPSCNKKISPIMLSYHAPFI